ncbi:MULTISPECIES: AfsR/SARP family transcriptional regulator [Actinokineospora]|uniref:Uncharacterized protein n=1 Tax=Actinokineospora fastidiosa TaxID=1816 RepID=A0A918GTC8_9PSEU|nr:MULTISPECIES: BTAD domain-containing putative transcriptional regulator [Actinokineospora]UVS79277.1 Molybdopterin biosynthesis positive regulator [Actinokineospora sp. UTMC 2448]GGS60150.1 hypothetical protein GCM10010171_63850 [Actinokineospora fastidiosa]
MLFHVLGPVEVRTPEGVVLDQRARKPATALATLLAHANAWVPTPRLIRAIWPETATPTSVEANLKTYVWRLRRTLPAPACGVRIDSRPGAYRLRVDPGELDSEVAACRAAEARQAARRGDHAAAAALCRQALGLWRGEPYGGLAVAEPLLPELDELRWALRSAYAEACAALGRVREADAALRELTDDDPLREEPWARWVRLLTDAGRASAALSVYARARAVLAEELGVEPGPALRAAHAAALRSTARDPARVA